MCKAPFKSSPSTNQHPTSYGPSCHPLIGFKALNRPLILPSTVRTNVNHYLYLWHTTVYTLNASIISHLTSPVFLHYLSFPRIQQYANFKVCVPERVTAINCSFVAARKNFVCSNSRLKILPFLPMHTNKYTNTHKQTGAITIHCAGPQNPT